MSRSKPRITPTSEPDVALRLDHDARRQPAHRTSRRKRRNRSPPLGTRVSRRDPSHRPATPRAQPTDEGRNPTQADVDARPRNGFLPPRKRRLGASRPARRGSCQY